MEKKEPWMYRFSRPIITFLFKTIYHPKMIGLENIPKTGGIVLAGTHKSLLDSWMLISSTKRTIHFLAKKELWKGIKGLYFGSLGMIPVDRSTHDHDALSKAIEYLKDDSVVLVFPEGTLERGRGLMEFKFGAVNMASRAGKKIVPFAVTGDYKPFNKNLTIEFGKPIKISKNKDLTEDNKFLRESVKALLKEE